MTKFNKTSTRTAVFSPVKSETTPTGRTFEGAPGYARDAKSELFLLAVSNMVGEDTFYENAQSRDDRYTNLIHTVAVQDPEWTARFLNWLRSEANMRSASFVGGLEAAKALLAAETPGGRQIVASVLQRADEPGEALAYWTGKYGRNVPKSVKRGIADAAVRLYSEYSLLKYDTDSKGWRFGDVLDIVHPTAGDGRQGDLFEHALDRRHNRANEIPESLTMVRVRAALMAAKPEARRLLLDPVTLKEAGMTWEALAGWLQGSLDAKAWETVIPSMGYMSLLRNLRNFDQAGVSDKAAKLVQDILSDPEKVAKSRQLPMRFLSAYNAAPSLRWSYPLEQALTASMANIPVLKGRTLILVDTSSSMNAGFSRDGSLMRWDAAAMFGIALGYRCDSADVVSFSSNQYYYHDSPGAKTKDFPLTKGGSLLSDVKKWKSGGWFLGGGTDTPGALRQEFKGHDRVVILTDEQVGTDSHSVSTSIPASVPLYTWNLAGYQHGHAPSGGPNRHTFAGLTDAGFKMVPLLDAGKNADWPF